MTPMVLNAHMIGINNLDSTMVYVGRPTPHGNPFRTGVDGTLDEVLKKHEEWVFSDPDRVRQIQADLRGKHLVCWCKPKRCHADLLLLIANSEELYDA